MCAKKLLLKNLTQQGWLFKVNDEEDKFVVVGIYLMCHEFGDSTFMSFSPDKSQYEVRACASLSKRKEVTISYSNINNVNLLIWMQLECIWAQGLFEAGKYDCEAFR